MSDTSANSTSFAELPDRTAGTSLLLLPMSVKDKDGRNKEEDHKLLNGNSVDPADWVGTGTCGFLALLLNGQIVSDPTNIPLIVFQRLRTQVNGKVLEDGNNLHDNAMNGA